MTFCQECARPWGVILDRGVLPSDEGFASARALLIADLRDYWDCEYEADEVDRIDWDALPPVSAVEVVYITEATSAFACDSLNADWGVETSCWVELAWCDLPSWLLKGRKRRWAYRWDCCDIGDAQNYMTKEAVRL